MDFEKLLLDLHSVLERGRTLIREHEQLKKDAVDYKHSLDNDREVLEGRIQVVNQREADVKHVENVDKLHKDATALMERAQLAHKAATEAQEKHKAYVVEENGKIDEKRVLLKKEANAVIVQRKALDEEVTKRVKEILGRVGLDKGLADAAA